MKYLGFLVFVISVNADSNKCPIFPITFLGTGEILLSEKYETPVPAGTNCLITFDTEIGTAARLIVEAKLSDNDTVVIIDTVGKVYQFSVNSFIYDTWLANGISTLNVSSATGTLQFWARYEYIDLAKYNQIQMYTGSYITTQLSSYGYNYITMTARNSSKVAISVDMTTTGYFNSVYVYDGANLTSSNMIGRLLDLAQENDRIYSSGPSISFVCFYNKENCVLPIVLANDADDVSKFSKYSVSGTKSTPLAGKLMDSSDAGSAHTFICDSCDTMYLNDLQFSDGSITDTIDLHGLTPTKKLGKPIFPDESTTGAIELQGLTPTQKLDKLIRYDKTTFQSSQIPQIIPSKMFTMYYQNCSINYNVSTESTAWSSLLNMRSGVIISPSQWDPSQSSDFDYTFEDDTQPLNVNLNFGGVTLNDEKLIVQIGQLWVPCINQTSVNGPCKNIKYNKNQLPPATMSIMGNYLRIALTGSSATNSSSVRIRFQFSNETILTTTVLPISTVSSGTVATPTKTMPTPSTPEKSVETTTKFSSTISIFSIFYLSFLKTFDVKIF